MLQQLQTQAARFGLALVVGILTIAFVFASPFNNNEGCGGSAGPQYAVQVYGDPVTIGDFDAGLALTALNMSRGRTTRLPAGMATQYNLRQHLLDGFVERALLAREAEALGFSVEQDAVWSKLREDGFALLTLGSKASELRLGRAVPLPVKDEDGNFDSEKTQNFIEHGLRRSVGEFAEGQRMEQLAEQMRKLIGATVHVGRQEVWDAYVQERDRAMISYVRFRPSFFGEGLEPDADTLAQYVAENREALAQEYESRKHEYTDQERLVRARHILVRLEEGASEETEADARARAEGILRAVQAKREPFSVLARRYSDDMTSARRGGRLAAAGNPETVATALATMGAGDTSALVQSPRGLHILHVDRVWEGTVPEEEALLDIAADSYRREQGKARAQTAADALLQAAREGASFEDALAGIALIPAPRDENDPLLGERPELPGRPAVESSRKITRSGVPITGVTSAPLISSIFDTLTLESPLPDEVLDVGPEFLVYRLTERERPQEAEFEGSARERISDGLMRSKREEAFVVYLHRLRQRAEQDGAIVINQAVLSEPATAARL